MEDASAPRRTVRQLLIMLRNLVSASDIKSSVCERADGRVGMGMLLAKEAPTMLLSCQLTRASEKVHDVQLLQPERVAHALP
jgi:hypothetical protein